MSSRLLQRINQHIGNITPAQQDDTAANSDEYGAQKNAYVRDQSIFSAEITALVEALDAQFKALLPNYDKSDYERHQKYFTGVEMGLRELLAPLPNDTLSRFIQDDDSLKRATAKAAAQARDLARYFEGCSRNKRTYYLSDVQPKLHTLIVIFKRLIPSDDLGPNRP